MDNTGELKFPVLIYKPDKMVSYLILNEDSLTRCNLLAYKKGWFNDLHIVDSLGNERVVVSALKARTYFTFPEFLFFNPQIRVKLILSDTLKELSISKFKKLILDSVKRNPEYFENIGYLKEVIQSISNSQTIEEMTTYLKKYL